MSKNSSRGSAWDRIRMAVLKRDAFVCAYCGREADTADHVIPKARGGTDDMSNLVAACNKCNGTKQDRIAPRITYINRRWLDHV